ncbi:hypothetical protein NSK_006073 [Nannochloropsis salina CCMP1776]|uniref:Ribosomal protein l27 n=2 Tax=Monodopsidaceae TaxID=425072 RepID=W7TQD3_9STRA|nr:large subunit ribosomal protein L27e [Nannochloropsis gaditana CCMP526]EKU23205.1 large subunit ribosomal protein L27e [Nannochloropsis gaditana CCMP526]EWM22601.1 ribosomal protein l27 [Nannochloropsis gaditana]TFJ82649.1 hypothetical protein NSK_006073 [Nannochloropsis salina CCMP1776]|eukprot:TFJ82649.1 hypothetical protein NSK_006073 [Nannochloropsis salina CCMP1776]
MGIIKPGKVVVVLAGRYAGKKAVVVKALDEGSVDKRFPHAIVCGIDVAPRKVTRSMNKKTIKRKSKVKPFVKAINYTHILPTRYVVDIDLKKAEEPTDDRKALKRAIRKTLEERYLDQASIAAKSERKSQGTAYFYKKLRF